MKVILLIFFGVVGRCLCTPFHLKNKRSTSLTEESKLPSVESSTPSSSEDNDVMKWEQGYAGNHSAPIESSTLSSSINNDDIKWQQGSAGNHPAPEDGVECGYDGDYVTYVARAKLGSNIIPGKLVPENNNEMHIPYKKREYRISDYEALISTNVAWVPAIDDVIPPNAIVGGKNSDNEPLYISRAYYKQRLICGTIDPYTKSALIPYNDTVFEFTSGNYEILVYSQEKIQKYTTTPLPTTPLPIYEGVHWVDRIKSNNEYLFNTIDCGQNSIVVGRALHKGRYIPGKLIRGYHENYMFITSNGEEHHKYYFQILVSENVEWLNGTGNEIPPNAVIGGHTSDNEPLYIGRAKLPNGGGACGKIEPQLRAVLVPFEGEEYLMTNYEILVEKPYVSTTTPVPVRNYLNTTTVPVRNYLNTTAVDSMSSSEEATTPNDSENWSSSEEIDINFTISSLTES